MGASKSGGGGRRYTPKPLQLKNPTSVFCLDQLKNLNSVKRAKSNDRLKWTHRFIFIEIYPGQGQNFAQIMTIFRVKGGSKKNFVRFSRHFMSFLKIDKKNFLTTTDN